MAIERPSTLDANRTTTAADTLPDTAACQRSLSGHASGLHLGLILLVGALARIPFYLASRPIWSGDSEGYASLYALWVHRHFFLGERTPVYPFFLGFAQWIAGVPAARMLGARGAYAAILLQSAVDVLAAPLFYLGLRRLRIRPGTALASALFLATIPAVCNYEMNILNMSFSFAWLILVASLFLFLADRIEAGKSIAALSIATGVASSFMALNRPEFLIFVILLLAITAALRWTSSPVAPSVKSLPKVALLAACAAAPALLAWMTIMYAGIGQFRITTLDGWNRSRTVYNLFDRVGPEDRVIGGIMAKTYRQEMQSGGVNIREIVWPAEREMFLAENLSRYPLPDSADNPGPFHQRLNAAVQRIFGFAPLPCGVKLVDYCWEIMRIKIDVGDYLGSVSAKLARRYPGAWLANVAENWADESFNFDYFEARPSRRGDASIAPGGGDPVLHPRAAELVAWLCKVDAPLLLLTYLVTLGCFLLSPLLFFRKHDEHWLRDAAVATLAVASVGTIVGTCVLAGFNRVYSLPHLCIFVTCTAYAWDNRLRLAGLLRAGGTARKS